MKISTRGRYGLRAMLDLAVYSKNEHVALKNIAERQKISESYLEQVFSILKKANLVKSIKGSQGGYMLAQDARKLTVGDILRPLEGTLAVVEEEDNAGTNINQYEIEQIIRANVWGKINDSINNVVDSITLDDLVKAFDNMNNDIPIMYYI